MLQDDFPAHKVWTALTEFGESHEPFTYAPQVPEGFPNDEKITVPKTKPDGAFTGPQVAYSSAVAQTTSRTNLCHTRISKCLTE